MTLGLRRGNQTTVCRVMMSANPKPLDALVESLQQMPDSKSYFRDLFGVISEAPQNVRACHDAGAWQVLHHLLVNSPAVRQDDDDENRFAYVQRYVDEQALEAADDLIEALLARELPIHLRARLLDYSVYRRRQGPQWWKTANLAVPALLESVRLAAALDDWSFHFPDHLRRATRLALRFQNGLREQVWDTIDQVTAQFSTDECIDRRITDLARIVIEFDSSSRAGGEVEDIAPDLEALLEGTISAALKGTRTYMADSAHEVLAAFQDHLGHHEDAQATRLRGVEAIVDRAGTRARQLGQAVQLGIAREKLQEIRSRGNTPQLEAKEHALRRRIKAANRGAKDEMNSYEWKLGMSKDEIRAHCDIVCAIDDPVARVCALGTLVWVPELERMSDTIELASTPSLTEMVCVQQPLGEDGRVLGRLTSRDDKAEVRYDRDQLDWAMYRATLLVGNVVNDLVECGRLCADDVVAAFEEHELVEFERVGILKRGVRAVLEEDYVTAVHLLAPQFEASVRLLYSRMVGKDVRVRQSRFKSASLSEILKDGDFAVYPRLKRIWAIILAGGAGLFIETDIESGPNLRNRVAHGLISADSCGRCPALLIFGSLLQLLLVDPDEPWDPDDPVVSDGPMAGRVGGDQGFQFKAHWPGKESSLIFALSETAPGQVWMRWLRFHTENHKVTRLDWTKAERLGDDFLIDLAARIRRKLWKEDREELWDAIRPRFDEMELDQDEMERRLEDMKTDAYIDGVGWFFTAETD